MDPKLDACSPAVLLGGGEVNKLFSSFFPPSPPCLYPLLPSHPQPAPYSHRGAQHLEGEADVRAEMSRGSHKKRQGDEGGGSSCHERGGDDSPEGTGACQGFLRWGKSP